MHRARIPGTVPPLRAGPHVTSSQGLGLWRNLHLAHSALAICPSRSALNSTYSPVNLTRDHAKHCDNHSNSTPAPLYRLGLRYVPAPKPSLGYLPCLENRLQGSDDLLAKRRSKDKGHPADHAATGLRHASSDHNKQHKHPCTPMLLLATIKRNLGPSIGGQETTHFTTLLSPNIGTLPQSY